MKAANWARDELRAKHDYWAALAGHTSSDAARPRSSPETVRDAGVSRPKAWIAVTPQVLFMTGIVGMSGRFRATCPGIASVIRARFSGPIDIIRISETEFQVEYLVQLTSVPDFDGGDAHVIQVEIRADGYLTNSVFVNITPHLSEVVSQTYDSGRIAPARVVAVTQRLSFGKHKGRTYQQVAIEDPSYLKWMLEEGAGSKIEQQCASAALGEGVPHKYLPSSGQRKSPTLAPAPQHSSSPHDALWTRRSEDDEKLALPDPSQRRGLLAAVKAVFRSRPS